MKGYLIDYKGIRNDFPALSEWTYLDTAFVGLYPRQVREGYDEFLDQWMPFNTLGKNTILNNWLDIESTIVSFSMKMPSKIKLKIND